MLTHPAFRLTRDRRAIAPLRSPYVTNDDSQLSTEMIGAPLALFTLPARGGPWSDADRAVDPLSQQVGVAVVSGVFLDTTLASVTFPQVEWRSAVVIFGLLWFDERIDAPASMPSS